MIDQMTSSEEETRAFGRQLADRLSPDGVLLLSGDLGVGKTVLVQGLAEGLGLDRTVVQSPTFSLIVDYRSEADPLTAPARLIHADLYRLAPEEVPAIGLEEMLFGTGVKVVEWAERLPFAVDDALRLKLERSEQNENWRHVRQL